MWNLLQLIACIVWARHRLRHARTPALEVSFDNGKTWQPYMFEVN